MLIVSHLYHLFNPETCQFYIHTLRWKDRPLQCPRCQSLNVGPWGTYHAQPGLKRYRCKEQGCQRTFNDLTGTLLDGSKRSVMHWILATFLLCLSCSSRRIARELGVHVRTSYRWCWWLRNAALSYEPMVLVFDKPNTLLLDWVWLFLSDDIVYVRQGVATNQCFSIGLSWGRLVVKNTVGHIPGGPRGCIEQHSSYRNRSTRPVWSLKT
jgi:transposase-like protein